MATSDGLNCWDVKPGLKGRVRDTEGAHVRHSVFNRRILGGRLSLGLSNLVSVSSWMDLGTGFTPWASVSSQIHEEVRLDGLYSFL